MHHSPVCLFLAISLDRLCSAVMSVKGLLMRSCHEPSPELITQRKVPPLIEMLAKASRFKMVAQQAAIAMNLLTSGIRERLKVVRMRSLRDFVNG
jgi:hypothetical protein